MHLIHRIVDYSNPRGFVEYMALMGFLLGSVAIAAHRDSHAKEDGRSAIEISGGDPLPPFSRWGGIGTERRSKHYPRACTVISLDGPGCSQAPGPFFC